MDLSGFLKELQYTFEAFSGDGNINSRLQTIESRYLLLEFLISELMTQKMLLKISKPKDKKDQNLKIVESPVAIALKDIAITLNLGKPPENISPESLFNKITSQLDETIKAIPDATKRIGKPLFNPKKSLNTDQWNKIAKIQHELDDEYNLRRKMLMTRLDVTIQSFKWSVKEPAKESLINERFSNKLQQIEKIQYGDRRTDVVALIAARDKIAIIEKTSSANVRKNTASKLQRHIIGKVPDRGGRALENQKPPPEMPSWQKRQSGGDNQRGGRGGNQRGGRGGPQNRGGYHQQQQQQKQGFPQDHYQQRQQHNPSNQSYYQQGDNNYQGNDGNFQQQRGGGHHRGGGGGRVQGGWNQGNQRGGHRGGNRGGRW
jgi:hypothetical protein